jgi:UDP-N-acetylmuramoyl-tripeptide--D-alanyl-D-alanine ligase
MAAIAIGLYFGVPLAAVAAAIAAYLPDNSRSQLLQKGTNQILLDAYNANPTSMQAAIRNFAHTAGGNKMLWLGGMKEMGRQERAEHQALIDLIGQYAWQAVILVGTEFSGMPGAHTWYATAAEAAQAIRQNPPRNAAILIKGSRGSKMELLLAALDEPYSTP